MLIRKMTYSCLRRFYSVPSLPLSLHPATLIKGKNDSSFCFFQSNKDFSNFPGLLKKKKSSSTWIERDEAEREEEKLRPTTKTKPTTVTKDSESDPWDFSNLHDGIKERMTWLQSELSKLRAGGGFNPDLLENLRVAVQRDSKKTESLGDLAQIIPKGGRSLTIHVGEKAHVKSIISAIQSATFLNLQPIQDPQEPTQLNVPIPPPTTESRDLALTTARKVGETAITGVRSTRALMQKKLRNIELKKLARPDDLKKAHKEMEKIVEKGITDIKKTIDVARKAIEQK
ncbi:Ribosome-recycling factor, mitochondrial [Erysiphe neolycopersici]|uniref:Ribosome-recycling factor, mitochondrial n=1 Tax=Erysiphe neolycopersici TaxID=212602 RepID=A0A420HA75_9PEZI|nr:Ribosome-recycling factor, mitochondrial [Erysiphe neolycopersici]